MLRIALAGLLVLAGTVLAPHGRAWAHASLLRSVPADGSVLAGPPAQIRLWFSEPIDVPVHALEVRGPDGRAVRLGKPRVAAEDNGEMVAGVSARAPGTYLVSWKVISADTHPVWGDFTFSIGAPSATPSAGGAQSPGFSRMALGLQVLGRWLNLLGGALALGPFIAWWWTLGTVAGRLEAAARRRAWRRLLRVVGLGSAALGISVPVAVLAQLTSLADSWSDALTGDSLAQVFSDRLGYVLGLRLVCAGLLWALCGLLAHLGPPADPRRRLPSMAWPAVALGTVPLLSTSLIGHAASTEPVALTVALDWLHLAAMAVWFGGLVALGAILPVLLAAPAPEQHSGGGERTWQVLGQVIPSFSALALTCVCILALTGLYSAVQHVGAPDQLLTTDYGRALSVKLGLVVLVLAVAAVNLLVLGPAVRRVGAGAKPRITDLWPLFRPLLRIEAALVVAVLGVVGLLTALAPARQQGSAAGGPALPAITVGSVVAAGGPHAVLAANIGTTLLTLAVAPQEGGPATVAVSLAAPAGPAVSASVSLRLVPPAGSGLAIVDADLSPQGAGAFAGSFAMNRLGTWTVGITVRTRDGSQALRTFSLPLPLVSGAAYLQRADRATNALHSAIMQQVISAGDSQRPTVWEFQAPDRMHYRATGDIETYRIGTHRWDRLPGTPWQSSTVDPSLAFKWPDQHYARYGPDAVVLGQDTVDGRACAIIGFWVAYPNATFRLWIDRQSGLIRRLQLVKPGAFEDDHYTSFNQAPAIRPPS